MSGLSRDSLPPPWDRIFGLGTRIFVWGVIFAALYILRSFFLLIFLTFVFAYIQGHAVDKLSGSIRSRTLRVVLVGVAFLAVLVGVGCFLVPPIRNQADLLASRYHVYLQGVDRELNGLCGSYPFLDGVLLCPASSSEGAPGEANGLEWNPETSPTVHLFRQLSGSGSESEVVDVRSLFETLRNIGAQLIAMGSAFLLSLLFSFLIVLDLPKLAESLRSLADSRVGFIYAEVAEGIRTFAMVLGRSLEAQLFIAIANTILTGSGIILLGLGEKLTFLSMIVFLCSFIPVAGVFISSVPICLLALQAGGLKVMMLAVLLIVIVHLIEAYILNPRIFGKHLHLNPVLVLIILTVGGKLFHVWGLVLGLPVSTYILGYAIRNHTDGGTPDDTCESVKG